MEDDLVDEAVELARESAELANDAAMLVTETIRTNRLLVAAAFVVGAGVGGFAAYKFAVKRTTLKYEEILQIEISEAREFYMKMAKEGDFSSPESAVAALIPNDVVDAVRNYQGRPKTTDIRPEDRELKEGETRVSHYHPDTHELIDTKIVMEERNVFVEAAVNPVHNPEEWDYDTEQKLRDANPNAPYVVSFEEYSENPENHEQETLTYYSADDTLSDPKDSAIDNTEYTVGDDNLLRFGAGSHDANVVYIRNERLGMDFEVVRSQGSFAREVLGIEPDDEDNALRHSLRHQNRRTRGAPRKFRGDDE